MFRFLFVLLFTISLIHPSLVESIEKSNPLTTTHNTIQHEEILKIEYIINNELVTDSELLSTLEKMTHFTVGSQFSRYAIQQSVISLYSSQEYSQVDVYTAETEQGIILKFDIVKVMKIEKRNITGIASEEINRSIHNVLRLEPGDMYFREIAEADMESIKRVCGFHGYFDVIVEVKTDLARGHLTYNIVLGDSANVTKFDIQGNSALFTEHIKEVCNTHLGNTYLRSAIDEDFTAIRSLYRKRYYPSIKIYSNFNHQSGLLTYNIEEGKQLIIDFVDDQGNTILQKSFLRKVLARLGISREESEGNLLRKRIERYINNQSRWEEIVQAHYQEKGYYGTEVQTVILTNSPLHVKFTIKPGNRYVVKSIEFIGNEVFSKEELLREIKTQPAKLLYPLISKRYFSELTLEKDKNRLEILYEKSGYPNVNMTTELKMHNSNNRKDGEVSIKLSIAEPYKQVIYRCSFIGNTVVDNKFLYEVLPNKPPQPNARLVQKNYENAILKTYHDRGYIDAEIDETEYKHKNDTPTLQIKGDYTEALNAGVLSQGIKEEFNRHNLSLTDMHVATETKIGEEWSVQDFEGNARYTLLQEKEQLSVYEHGILQFSISEGDKIVFGKFKFNGDLGVIPNVLNREVSHLTGSLYTPDKLNLVRLNISNTRIFEPGISYERSLPTGIEAEASNLNDNQHVLLPVPQTVVNDVEFRLQKRKAGSYGASVGVSSSDGIRGTILFSHLNLLKRNIRFHLRARGGVRAYLYDTTLTEPWLIGRTSGSLHFLGRQLEEDDGVRALQGSFNLSRKLPHAHRLNLEYNYRFLKDTSLDLTETDLSTTVSSVSFLWIQDTQFPSLNPVSGMLNQVTVEYAGGILGSRSSFIKTVANSIFHQQLHKPDYVLSTSLTLGLTTGLQQNRESELISFERFWAGGSTTVRGYEERGLGPEDITGKHRGNAQFIFNTELRFAILNPIHGILFLDSGNVWGTVTDVEFTWMPTSVGVGLRLNLGPLIGGVDYAVPLLSVPGVPTKSLYFRLGNTF